MRVPLSWLADYVDIEMPVDDLAHRLTMAGLKVESVERLGAAWTDVIIGEVVELEPHARSTNPLWVARVDFGNGRIETIVTGAPNVRLGDKVPVVPVGGVVPSGPNGPVVIEARPMAGITSQGMLLSPDELGLAGDHSGLLILPPESPVGAPLRTFMGDDILDIETNPNRPDTLSIIGIAREVAAITEQQLTLPDLYAIGGDVLRVTEPSVPIDIESQDLCPRYSALRIDDVPAGESPFWMRQRLQLAGMRPINLVVDITNYVMLEYGQPMHAFDASRIGGDRIVVRRARPLEDITTLDGVQRHLTPDDLVIADAESPIGIAGVMGGENSEVGPSTSSIVLESATFDPVSVRRTAKRLDLRSEASSRFEKGLPPEQTVLGLKRYLQLLAQSTDAPLRAYDISDAWIGAPEPRRVTMPMRDLDRLLGIEVPRGRAAEILSRLGFDVTERSAAVTATVPFWRRADIALAADLVEEVGRVVGFDAIPAALPAHTVAPPPPLPELRWEHVICDALLAVGATQVVTHTLTSAESMSRLLLDSAQMDPEETYSRLVPNAAGVYAHEALTLPVILLNPPSRDRSVLRLTLLPSLLDEIARNLRHTEEYLALFEVARTYFRRPADLPYERRTLALALSGRREPVSWQSPEPQPYSFYDLKGMVTAILDALGVANWRVVAREHPALHPGRAAVIQLPGRDVGFLGELHPEVAERFEIEDWPVQVAELDLDAIFPVASDVHVFRPIPRLPAARRDIALVVPSELPAGEVLRVVKSAGGDILESARIFDVYAGEPLPADCKSIAVAMEFRAPGHTLAQDEVVEGMERIVDAARGELGAAIRE